MPKTIQQTATTVLHGAEAPRRAGAPVSSAITAATSFYADPASIGFSGNDLGADAPSFYTRWGNPTVAELEGRLTLLEGGAGAVAFGSGMAAISSLWLSVLSAGDHLVISDVCYAGAAELAHDILPRFGITVSRVDTSDLAAVKAALQAGKTKLIHVETPANPTLRLADIAGIATLAREAGAQVSVDSTIATPIATQPIALGADYVVHSMTKYICGHGDALGGIVVAAKAGDLAALRNGALIHHGAALSPFAAWLILRGLETLPARMRVHEENARVLATFLQGHPAVAKVHWPGLADHPQAELAKRQMKNFSGLLSFTLKDGAASAALALRMHHEFEVISYAVSLGKTKSLMFYIPTDDILSSSFHPTPKAEAAYREAAGAGVFRFSVGIEDAQDLIRDLQKVLG